MAVPLLPLLGMLGGGGIGGLLGSSAASGGKSFLFGDKAKTEQFPRYTQEQQDVFSQLLQQGKENTDFSGIESAARKNFSENMIPSIAERFTAMGGGQRSSAFQSALGNAESNLESQLSALRPQFGMQQLRMGLQPQFDTAYTPATGGLAQGGIGQIAQILPLLIRLFSQGGM